MKEGETMYFPKPAINENDLAIIERGDTASHSIEAGQYVSWKGKLGKAVSAILQGATLDDSLFSYETDGVINELNNKTKLFPDQTRILSDHHTSGVTVNYTATEDCYFIGWVIASDGSTKLKLNNVEILVTAYSNPTGQSWTLNTGAVSMFLKQGDVLTSTGFLRYIVMGLR